MALQANAETDRLFQAILSLRSVEECYRFFEDLCTVHEIQAIAQRLAVADMLSKGGSYQSTSTGTGVSCATICRVKRCLEYGSGGYQMVLGRLAEAGESDS